MVTLLQTLLKMEGFETAVAHADDDVPALILREKPDFIIMDVHLGQYSGLDIVDSIRQTPELANLCVIMTSGLNMKDECIQRGANYFILKPFMPDELLSLLKANAS